MNRAFTYRYRRSRGTELNMAPLIDMVFILLIFFLVTTSFVREAGVEIVRPQAQSASIKEKTNMIIGVAANGVIYIEGKTVDVRSVRARMERFVAEIPLGSVVVVADQQSETGIVVQIMDACRLAGVRDISLAAEKIQP
jgi:biopolymer transport protein ExbD